MNRSWQGVDPRLKTAFETCKYLYESKCPEIEMKISCTMRTEDEQQDLFASGRSKPGKILTNCDGTIKRSKHQDGKAIDIYVLDKKTKLAVWQSDHYKHFAELMTRHLTGITWGGDFKALKGDIYHFEV